METGVYGSMTSTNPPITIPAWMSMMTSKDPGQLGIYGIRNRADRSYSGMRIASSSMVSDTAAWDIVSSSGRQVVLLGVPLTYPPKPLNGCVVADFLTPSLDADYTHPSSLKDEVRHVVGDYAFDVADFRTGDKVPLLARIYEKTEKHFTLARHLMTTRPWDLFVVVEIGSDRLQHGFWHYSDTSHVHYDALSPFQDAIRDYYVYLDGWVGNLLCELPRDTLVLVVSDHGAQRMDGGICINEWLMQEGYLRLRSDPEGLVKVDEGLIDWPRTAVWADGGYYGRLFVNLQGREPQGTVDPDDKGGLLCEIAEKLTAMTDESGHALGTRVFAPEQLYVECLNVPPDLIVHFGDLLWRSVGTVGRGSIWTRENDTGPDDANHAEDGMFIMSDLSEHRGRRMDGRRLYDIAPTIIDAFGLAVPGDMIGEGIGFGDAGPSNEQHRHAAPPGGILSISRLVSA